MMQSQNRQGRRNTAELMGVPRAAAFPMHNNIWSLAEVQFGYRPTQSDISQMTGVSMVSIGRIISGSSTRFDAETIYRLCAVLGARTIGELVDIDNEALRIIYEMDIKQRMRNVLGTTLASPFDK